MSLRLGCSDSGFAGILIGISPSSETTGVFRRGDVDSGGVRNPPFFGFDAATAASFFSFSGLGFSLAGFERHFWKIVRVVAANPTKAGLARPLGGDKNDNQHHTRRGRNAAEHYFLGIVCLALFLVGRRRLLGCGPGFPVDPWDAAVRREGSRRRGGNSPAIADRPRHGKRGRRPAWLPAWLPGPAFRREKQPMAGP